jgi:ankyrin repeat protein
MKMASPLEALPNEILDSILEYLINHAISNLRGCDHLDCAALSRLSQCSHFLNYRLEPLLYGTFDARNAALRNGCMTGNLHAIRKAVSYGANPGVLRRYILNNNTIVHAEQETGYREVHSLQVALKSGQLKAYNLLLDLGASLTPHNNSDAKIMNSQLVTFAQRLAEPGNVAFLKAFVEARAETPYWKDNRKGNYSQAHAVVSRLPFPHVVRWASLALLETLLNNGAPLDQIITSSHVGLGEKLPLTPLGAACLRGDINVFNLLIARGAHADIEDSLRSKYPTKYTHIPVFVAAHYMADKGNSNMLDACIAGGADVNRPCHVYVAPSPEYTQPELPHVCTTPLLTYLRSIKSWDTASSGAAKQHLTPSEGVAHFIHGLGANIPSPVAPPVKRKYNNSDQELYDRTFAGIPSPVELLLAKWGIESLAIPEVFSTIKLLIEHGGTGPDLARILVRFEGQNEPGGNMVDVERLWQQFLVLLLPQLDSLDQISKNALLRRVMVDKTIMRHRVGHPSHWVKVRAIGRASISAVVRAGADINNVVDASNTNPHTTMKTPLHELISEFVHTDCLTEDFLHDHPKGHACSYTRDVVESLGDFLAFLVSEGADPLVEDTNRYRRDEKTAIDTLLSPMKEGRIANEGGTVEKGLMHLVARLQGASQALNYTGDRKPYTQPFWRSWRLSSISSADCLPKNAR